MIPHKLRITLIIAIICYFILILLFLKRKALSLRYTLLWLVAGVVMAAMVIWPELLSFTIHLVGIESNMNGLFLLCIGFIIIILMSLTSIVSRQRNKIKVLTQEMAVLEARIRELETSL